jgi:glucosamine-6-phosphate deaminase
MVDVEVLPSPAAVASRVADVLGTILADKPAAVLGLAAGSSPLPVYAELVRRHRDEGLSFARATVFGLDEYVGLPAAHPASFRRSLELALYRQVDLSPARLHGPDVDAPDADRAAARYEEEIAAAGGFDLVLLGIGGNGHIAFNEPGAPFDSRTRVVTLADETRRANLGAFPDGHVPARAITIGVATILSSRACLLVACGPRKARAIAAMLEGPRTTAVPASALRDHPHAMVVIDAEAARELGASGG